MKTIFISLLISLVSLTNARGQESKDLNSILMRSTFKIVGAQGGMGTVFILSKKTRPNSEYYYYILVTAKHVLDEIKSEDATLFLREKQNDTYVTLPHKIKIRNGKQKLYTSHPTEDIAAMRINFPKNADLPGVDYNLLATDEEIEKFDIHPGDELSCLGFPYGFETNPGSFPVLRSGKIASYPLIPVSKTRSFLLDFEIYKGNSGGPVYLVESNPRYRGKMELGTTLHMIMGLVSSEATLKEHVKSMDEERLITHKLSIATIIHAQFIKETIEMIPSK